MDAEQQANQAVDMIVAHLKASNPSNWDTIIDIMGTRLRNIAHNHLCRHMIAGNLAIKEKWRAKRQAELSPVDDFPGAD